MSIISELEKLTSLRDRGDLSHAEFEKAKTLLLSEEAPPTRSAHEEAPDSVERKTKKEKTLFLVAILSTVTVALAAGSATIAPSPINLLILILFVTAATLNWTTYAKIRKERRN